jgi:hypothetical protein
LSETISAPPGATISESRRPDVSTGSKSAAEESNDDFFGYAIDRKAEMALAIQPVRAAQLFSRPVCAA